MKERDSAGKTHVWNNILQFHASIELFGGQTWHLVKQIFEDIWDCRLKKKVYIDIKLNFIKIRYLYSSSWDKCRRISISFAINSGGYFYSKLKKVPFLFKKCTHTLARDDIISHQCYGNRTRYHCLFSRGRGRGWFGARTAEGARVQGDCRRRRLVVNTVSAL